MLSTIYSAGIFGIDGYIVTVECNSMKKPSAFEIVGLPDASIKEAKERVRAAAENGGIKFPGMAHTVNLAPADKRKEGSGFDVAILMGILRNGGYINRTLFRSVHRGPRPLHEWGGRGSQSPTTLPLSSKITCGCAGLKTPCSLL